MGGKSVPTKLTEENEYSSQIRSYKATEFDTSCNENDYLGRGAFGAARKCFHEELGLIVAKCTSLSGTKEDIKCAKKSIRTEVNALSRCKHENIVAILGTARWSNNIAIILEYVKGGNLQEAIKNFQPIAWCVRLQIAQQIASALSYLHFGNPKKTMCHGDLKPSNVLLAEGMKVKVADFGAAARKIIADASTSSISLPTRPESYTECYAPPELLKDRTLECCSSMDMYSFGALLLELVTKYDFNRQKKQKQLKLVEREGRKLPSDRDQSLFQALNGVLENCLERKPQQRPSSNDVRDELATVLKAIDEDELKHESEKLFRQLIERNTKEEGATMKLSELKHPFDNNR